MFAAWYPIKHRAPLRAFSIQLQESGIRDIVAVEVLLREPIDPARLNGCGMVVINPPFHFELEASAILDALHNRFGRGEPGAGAVVIRLADE